MAEREGLLWLCMAIVVFCLGSTLSANANWTWDDAVPSEYPFHARIMYNGVHKCSGALVHGCYVLTSKYCVKHNRLSDLRVRLGHDMTDGDSFKSRHRVVTVHMHPTSDVALLLITPSANLRSPKINAIIPIGNKPPLGTNATVTGWGDIISPQASVLQKLEVSIADPAMCDVSLPFPVQPDAICAGRSSEPYPSQFYGDSGSPLVVKNFWRKMLVGVLTSSSLYRPWNMNYATYVNVAGVRSWIWERIPINNKRPGSSCHCIHPAIKHDGTQQKAVHNNGTCRLGIAREGCLSDGTAKGFIENNRYYIASNAKTHCPMGTFDTCNCKIMPIPSNGFTVWPDKLYHNAVSSLNDSCPTNTTNDGVGCLILTAPMGSHVFKYIGDVFMSAQHQCPEQFELVNGTQCRYNVTPGPNPFIHNNGFYSHKIGTECPSGSKVTSSSGYIPCYFGQVPWATEPSIQNNLFYVTPRRQCLPEAVFDGKNCLVYGPPLGAEIFIEDGWVYYKY